MADVKLWSPLDSGNAGVSPDGANTGWTGSQVGPWARETMASVARWYADPAWVNPTRGLADEGAKNVLRVDNNTVRISCVSGDNVSSNATEVFCPERLIRLVLTGGTSYIYAFVKTSTVSGSPQTVEVTLAPLNQATIGAGTTFVDDGIEVYGAQTNESNALPFSSVGPISFSRYGTTSERNALFAGTLSDYPSGIIWFNTTEDLIQVLDNGVWRDVSPLRDVYDSGGSVFRVGRADSPPGAANSAIHMYSPNGAGTLGTGTGTLRFFERNVADNAWLNRSIIYGQEDGNQLALEAPRQDTNGVVGTFGRISIKGAGDPNGNEGKIFHTSYTPDPNNNNELVGTTKNLTPGEIDAGTLNTLSANDIVERSLNLKWYKWKMSGAAHPAGDGTDTSSFVRVSSRHELARFAFPSALINELGVGNTYRMYFGFALNGFSGASGNTDPNVGSYPNASNQLQIHAYAGNNYGSPSTTIPNFPSSGEGRTYDWFMGQTVNQAFGTEDYWASSTDHNYIEATITSNFGVALAAQRDGPNSDFYARINASVLSAGSSIPAQETFVYFEPVRSATRAESTFESEAQ